MNKMVKCETTYILGHNFTLWDEVNAFMQYNFTFWDEIIVFM